MICQETHAKIKILPGVFDLIDGNVTVNDSRVQWRTFSAGNQSNWIWMVSLDIADKVVLVTGAGGSIGPNSAARLLHINPASC